MLSIYVLGRGSLAIGSAYLVVLKTPALSSSTELICRKNKKTKFREISKLQCLASPVIK